jgi:hypothetical protein
LVSSPYNFWLATARLVERNSCFAYLACTRRTEEGMIQGFLDVSFFFFQKFNELKGFWICVIGHFSSLEKKGHLFFYKKTQRFFYVTT